MKFVLSKLMAAAAVTLCLAAPAMAQYYTPAQRLAAKTAPSAGAEVFASDLQPGSEDGVAPSPSDAPAKAAPGPAAGPSAAGPCESCLSNNGCCCDCCDDHLCCPKTEPWRIFENCCTKKHSLVIQGWIDGGATYNSDEPASRFNGPVTYNDREEGQLNQFYMFAQKTVKTDECCIDVGGRFDLLYGTDSRFTKALGLELHQDGNDRWNSERFYQLSMPQAYAELGYCDWSVKVGRFYTILGYEVAPAPDNFFYSHSYEFQYAEPLTHTGLLATKKVNDQFSFSLGVTTGWDQWEDANDKLSLLAGVNFANCDQSRKLAIAITSGDEFAPFTGVDGNRTAASLVYTRTLNERLTYVFQSDYGFQDDGVRVGNQLERAEWYGVNQYLLYQLNCCWWSGLRFEWFRDDDGTRVSSINSGSFPSGNPAIGGYEGDFTQLALGLNYKPSANLIVRPEVRWDHYNGRPGPNGLPFDDGSKDDQFLMAIDAILKF